MDKNARKNSEQIIVDIQRQIKKRKTQAVKKLREVRAILECEGESCLLDIEHPDE